MGHIKVRDLMTEEVLSVRDNEDVAKTYQIMLDKNVRHVPVVDTDDELVGIISQRDLIHGVLYNDQELPYGELQELMQTIKVRELMVADPESIGAGQDAAIAASLMLENKLGCLPVVEGNHLAGIITESDFLKYFLKQVE